MKRRLASVTCARRGLVGAAVVIAAVITALPAVAQSRPNAKAAPPAVSRRAPVALAGPREPSPRPAKRTVVVDAGHGGPDRGMTGMTSRRVRIYEKDIALQVATKVAARLENAGTNVVMTRTRDTLIALADRGKIANREGGTLFVSVHVNAANPNWRDPSAARGFETYFLAEAKTDDDRRVAAIENEVVRFETDAEVPRDDPLGMMLSDMAQNEYLRESSELAQTIQTRMRGVHPGPSRGVKQAGFMVLVKAFMPSVLVEIGFGTNRSDADWIASSAGQARLADAIATGVLDYLARWERRVSGGSSATGK